MLSVREEFESATRARWSKLVESQICDGSSQSRMWRGVDDIVTVLYRFDGRAFNRTYFPDGTSEGIERFLSSNERCCLDMGVHEERGYICKPATLRLEHFPESPWNSFFLLECGKLDASGLYTKANPSSEDVVELPGCDYQGIEHLHDPIDIEALRARIPGNQGHRRLVTRLCGGGTLLIVSGSSLWAKAPSLQGGHRHLRAEEIRELVGTLIKVAGELESRLAQNS